MGWFNRLRGSRISKSELRDADRLPVAQKIQLASEMQEFIREFESITKGPNEFEELDKLYQFHRGERQRLAYSFESRGPDIKWLRHAIPESYLGAYGQIDPIDRKKLFGQAHRDLVKWIRDSGISVQPSQPESLDTSLVVSITAAQAARGCKVLVKTETGTKISLSIPKNTRSGTKLRVAGGGKKMGGRVGDQYVHVRVDTTKDGN